MSRIPRALPCYAAMVVLLAAVGFGQSWSVALSILHLCLISAVMSLGLNIQWGYAGLFNVGVMGFAAVGGATAVLVSMPPVAEAWSVGGAGLAYAALAFAATVAAVACARALMPPGNRRMWTTLGILAAGYGLARMFFDPAVEAIEAFEPAKTGYLGGLNLPIILSWPAGAAAAAGAAWLIGRVALGLRADYLAIATLGISEIIIAVLKNEDWLTRGVKNVTGLPRPVPYEVDLQGSGTFRAQAERFGLDAAEASTILVKLCYAGLFVAVLVAILFLAQRALHSPWGRMMRAIKGNETAAEALGKDVARRHREVFVIGAGVIGIAGAMLTTLDGQFTPSSYQPLRFTFLIWVMVIVGGSGNNWGAVLGGFLVWFVWIEAEPVGMWFMDMITSGMDDGSSLRQVLLDRAAHMRPCVMGLILLLVLRFSPRGLIPDTIRR